MSAPIKIDRGAGCRVDFDLFDDWELKERDDYLGVTNKSIVEGRLRQVRDQGRYALWVSRVGQSALRQLETLYLSVCQMDESGSSRIEHHEILRTEGPSEVDGIGGKNRFDRLVTWTLLSAERESINSAVGLARLIEGNLALPAGDETEQLEGCLGLTQPLLYATLERAPAPLVIGTLPTEGMFRMDGLGGALPAATEERGVAGDGDDTASRRICYFSAPGAVGGPPISGNSPSYGGGEGRERRRVVPPSSEAPRVSGTSFEPPKSPVFEATALEDKGWRDGDSSVGTDEFFFGEMDGFD